MTVRSTYLKTIGILLIVLASSARLSASLPTADTLGEEEDFNNNVSEFILHHVGDDYQWHIMGSLHLYLPVMVVSNGRFDVFSSKHLFHGTSYNGYLLDHGKLTRADGASFLNFSITKNVFSLFISAILISLIFISIARSYKKRDDMVPRGFQSLMEPLILFVRDDIVRPSIGEKKYARYMPYLLTLFFFILINNLLGLIPLFPGGANLTGNIATTMTLAVITLLVILFSGNQHYWKHIFWPPGVPIPLKLPIAAIEFIGIFTKPFALMIRLFANITAGHIIILSILSLTFIYQSYAVGVGTSFFALFMNILELLVAVLQAYIFTMLSAIFIGQAVEEPEHH
ncbi:MAG TPA: F0F1 ATP synthase subunit A [Bacteroidales bacterium]|nr:F0F1 ATP synthase subunit A [Bacteroidales bacterium]